VMQVTDEGGVGDAVNEMTVIGDEVECREI